MAFFGTIAARLMGRTQRIGVLTALSVLVAVACTPVYRNHGYVPADDELAQVQVGVDTQETVATKVGRPSLEGLLNSNGWFYVQSRFKQVGPKAPVEIDRQVVAISFDEGGKVANIERFGLEKGRVVTISRRVTKSSVAGISLISQLLGSVGRLRADQLVD